MLSKENNFAQAGQRWRNFDRARQERFVQRVSAALLEDRVAAEVRSMSRTLSAAPCSVFWNPGRAVHQFSLRVAPQCCRTAMRVCCIRLSHASSGCANLCLQLTCWALMSSVWAFGYIAL